MSDKAMLRIHPRLLLGLTVLLVLLALGLPVHAQTVAPALDELTVDIWPDFDEPAVLVLLTGRLPADTTYPATITLPVPASADLHAVARITADGNMLADLTSNREGDELTLTTPDPRFRVEYYFPYETADGERAFTFDWLADALSVQQLAVTIQEPVVATDLTTDPDPMSTTEGQDGLTYYHLPPANVPAGTRYSAALAYAANGDQLTMSALAPAQSVLDSAEAAAVEPVSGAEPFNWTLWLAIAGGALILVAVGYQFLSTRRGTPARRARPRPRRSESGTKRGGKRARFCQNCGEAVQEGDRFCRSCGTELKAT